MRQRPTPTADTITHEQLDRAMRQATQDKEDADRRASIARSAAVRAEAMTRQAERSAEYYAACHAAAVAAGIADRLDHF